MSTYERQVITVTVNSTSDNVITGFFIGPKKISCELRSNKLLSALLFTAYILMIKQTVNNTDLQSVE